MRLPANVNPAVEREVDTLSAVEPQIETGMVAHRKGDDKLALSLNERVRTARRLGQEVRRCEERLMSQELFAIRHVPREIAWVARVGASE